MKYALVVSGLLATNLCFGQATQPVKGAATALVHTQDTPSQAYIKLGQLLLADGYIIDKSDPQLGFINTKSRIIQANRGVEVAMQIAISEAGGETLITERGAAKMPYLGEFPASFRGGANSPVGRAWAELERVARLYPGATVTYK